MKRNKIITIRVNERLYNDVKKIIDEKTEIYTVFYRNSKKNIYYYKGEENKMPFSKFSIADLVENAFKDFINSNKIYV